jgi:hypothetical protein
LTISEEETNNDIINKILITVFVEVESSSAVEATTVPGSPNKTSGFRMISRNEDSSAGAENGKRTQYEEFHMSLSHESIRYA